MLPSLTMAETKMLSPTTHLDCALDDSVMTTSGYSQVVFHSVQESYTPGTHIECRYTLTRAIRPSSRDWVGIFKVGWSSTRQYKAFDWAPYPTDWMEDKEYEQKVVFNSYYLPKEEDGEFYQFCFIDSAGKMRGASTPFQFLERPADDFVEVEDQSMGLLMIQSKACLYEEELKKILKEKDKLLSEQSEMHSKGKELEQKVESLEEQIGQRGSTLDSLSKDYQDLKEQHQSLLREKAILEGRLEEVLNALSSLEQDKARCEKALEATKARLLESQSQTARANAKKDQLVKDLSQVLHERDEFKTQFASSESANKDLRNEISRLLKQLSETNQATQHGKQLEGRIREEKRKLEQQLLVATADRDHMRNTEMKLLSLEDQYAACEASRRMLCEEVDTMKAFQHKLSNDLQRAETDKDALKGRMARYEKEHKERETKLKNTMRLHQHQGREKETMLKEQVQALKDSIKQLAEEKEQALRSNKGPMEASQVVMKQLKDKLKKTQAKLEEETKKRVELQKKMSALEAAHGLERDDLTREVSDMKVRLQMGADEYRKKYFECRQLEGKLKTKGSGRGQATPKESVAKEDDKQLEVKGLPVELENLQGASGGVEDLSPVQTFDSAELQVQLQDLARELEERNLKIKKYKSLYQVEKQRRQQQDESFRMERMAFEMQLEAANSCADELNEKKLDNKVLREKVNKLHDDYMKMKFTHEMYMFDTKKAGTSPASDASPPIYSPPLTPPQMSPIHSPSPSTPVAALAPAGPPMGQYMYRNPYTDASTTSSFYPNPYAPGAPDSEGAVVKAIPGRGNPFVSPEKVSQSPLSPPLLPLEGSSPSPPPSPLSSSPSPPPDLPPRKEQSTPGKAPLPEPLKPDVLPEAKIAAIKTVAKKTRLLDLAVGLRTEGSEDDREEGPSEFHDACEDFPPGEGASSGNRGAARASRSSAGGGGGDGEEEEEEDIKHCPECDMHFPPAFSEDDFAHHIQLHFARLCPMCNLMMPCQTPDAEYERHVQTHFGED